MWGVSSKAGVGLCSGKLHRRTRALLAQPASSRPPRRPSHAVVRTAGPAHGPASATLFPHRHTRTPAHRQPASLSARQPGAHPHPPTRPPGSRPCHRRSTRSPSAPPRPRWRTPWRRPAARRWRRAAAAARMVSGQRCRRPFAPLAQHPPAAACWLCSVHRALGRRAAMRARVLAGRRGGEGGGGGRVAGVAHHGRLLDGRRAGPVHVAPVRAGAEGLVVVLLPQALRLLLAGLHLACRGDRGGSWHG
jgi:hypothetical protein